MSSKQTNEAIVRACYEVGTKGDLDVLPELVTDDYVRLTR